jgi:hypothetical protein
MALPTSYLTTAKNLNAIFAAIQGAQAPEKFNIAFLESLEFKSSSDRLIIGVLRVLGFIDDTARPKDRYFRFLDQTQGAKVLAEGIREAYHDLFKVNTKANELSKQEVINKFKTLGQGQITEPVLDKMAMTFTVLVRHADFQSPHAPPATQQTQEYKKSEELTDGAGAALPGMKLGGLVYSIQIVLPESRDPAVYDALFTSLRRHLL